MTLDTENNPREQVLDEMVALAKQEAIAGDGRALRVITRYREMVSKPRVRPLHQDDGV